MKSFSDSPVLLLLGTGIGLGLNFPLGKMALAAGVAPPLWAASISLGAGLALLVLGSLTEPKPSANLPLARFAVISGFISYVMPNLLTFTVIPKIGSGLAAVMFALSPMVTALLSLVLKVRPPNSLGLVGIALGLIGALVIVSGKDLGAANVISPWVLLGLAIPLFLGTGNVYRSLDWPQDAGPRFLGSLTNLAAVPFLIGIALVLWNTVDLSPLGHIPILMAAQLAASTAMFAMFFRLQQVGGPTYLSQIGYVAAALGLIVGVGLLGEHYPFAVWFGAAIIATGVALTTFSARRPE
jgi:drug/metabolite transporter (DMT)-like permease